MGGAIPVDNAQSTADFFMQLSEQALKEFEEIWQHDHPGKILSREELFKIANKVIHIVEILYVDAGDLE